MEFCFYILQAVDLVKNKENISILKSSYIIGENSISNLTFVATVKNLLLGSRYPKLKHISDFVIRTKRILLPGNAERQIFKTNRLLRKIKFLI